MNYLSVFSYLNSMKISSFESLSKHIFKHGYMWIKKHHLKDLKKFEKSLLNKERFNDLKLYLFKYKKERWLEAEKFIEEYSRATKSICLDRHLLYYIKYIKK